MFKVAELLKATQGKLVNGSGETALSGISIDSRTLKKNEAFIAIKGCNFDGHDFIDEAIKKGAKCVIQEAGRSKPGTQAAAVIEVRATQKALGDIAASCRERFDIPVIAITGSNGKTTTKEMIVWVLAEKFKVHKNEGTKNNQFGLPLALIGLNPAHEIVVLEIGTNHFGEVGYLSRICRPNIAVITNIGPAHLEYFGDLKGVFKEKSSLLSELKKPHLALLNADDALLRQLASRKKRKPFTLSFGIKNKSDFSISGIRRKDKKLEFSVNSKYKFSLITPGYHHLYNALVAIALARLFGMGYKEIATRLSLFKFPEGRLNHIKLKEINFIDDTYNSNPASLKQALDALANLSIEGRKIFVMGDMLELGSQKEDFHRRIADDITKVCHTIITVGELSKFTAQAVGSCGFDTRNIFTCDSCEEARDILLQKVSPKAKDIVLVKGSRAMKMERIFKDL